MNGKRHGFAGLAAPEAGRSMSGNARFQGVPALPVATAEIMTKACASGQSSVI